MSDTQNEMKRSWFSRLLPGLTLMIMAPAIAELLPGATRVSSAFVFPIEILIWGSGAALARFFVRKYRLGWFNLLLLAVALAVAEECLIQQTSFAPLIIQLKGVEYGRAFGINYVYFLWAVLYEALFVVCIPVLLCEMMFPARKDQPWLSGWGIAIMVVLFGPACGMAWYGWNMIARVQVFHLAPYSLPGDYAIGSAVAIGVLILAALGPARRWLAGTSKPLSAPHPLVLAGLGMAVAAVIFGIEVLAFGILPTMPVAVPLIAGIGLGLSMLILVPRWMAAPNWTRRHDVAVAYGATLANFGLLFIGFGDNPVDLYGKIVLDVLGALLMLWLAVVYLRKRA